MQLSKHDQMCLMHIDHFQFFTNSCQESDE